MFLINVVVFFYSHFIISLPLCTPIDPGYAIYANRLRIDILILLQEVGWIFGRIWRLEEKQDPDPPITITTVDNTECLSDAALYCKMSQ